MTAPAPASPAPAPVRRTAASSAVWLVPERILKALGTGVLFIVLARYFGPEDYGRLATALSLGDVAKVVAGLGIYGLVQRELTRRPELTGGIVGTFLRLSLATGLVCGAGLTALALWAIDDPQTQRMTLALAWIGLPQALAGAELWFMATLHPRPVVLGRNLAWLAFLLLRIGMMIGHAPLTAFAWVAVADWASTYLVMWWLFRRHHPAAGPFVWSGEVVRGWVRDGWPLAATMLFGLGADRFMPLILQNAGSISGAGQFGLASKCIDPWWAVAGVAAFAFLPRLTQAHQRSHAECNRLFARYLDLSMLITVTVALAMTFAAPLAVGIAFGHHYRDTVLPLVLLGWASPAIFSAQARLQYLTAQGRLLVELPTCIANTALQFLLSLVLVPRWDSAGAAAAITISWWVTVYGVPWLLPQAREAARAQWHAFGFIGRLPSIIRELRETVRAGLQGALR